RFVGLGCGAREGDMVVVHTRGDTVADEHVIVPFGTPDAAIDIDDAAEARAAVRVLAHHWPKAEGIACLAKLRIGGAADELRDGIAVAVSGIQIAPRVP